jgi:glucan phosphoethanolaminetransferase (alkaline phosphatase superfamily)
MKSIEAASLSAVGKAGRVNNADDASQYRASSTSPLAGAQSPRRTDELGIVERILFFTIQGFLHGRAVLAVIFTLSAFDLALLERKYNLFSGGFLQVDRIATLADRALFTLLTVSLEAALASCFWFLLLALGLRLRTPIYLIRYQFLFFYGGISIVVIIAKYKVLAYFGDFVSMAVLRNLGGGSLNQAILYALEEGVPLGATLSFAVAGTWYFYRLKKSQSISKNAVVPTAKPSYYVSGAAFSICALVLISTIAQSGHAMHKHLLKVTPYALANVVMSMWADPVQTTLMKIKTDLPVTHSQISSQVAFPGRKDNLIFIVSESTRADVIDALVEGKPVTPNWRTMAKEGIVARDYYSHTGFTTSSLKAIFRASLGANLPLGGTMFDVLKANGYQIVVISGQDESFGDIAHDSASEKSADIFFDARTAANDRVFSSKASGSLTLSNNRVLQEFIQITHKVDWSRPVFFYVNFQSAHFPYYHQKMPKLLNEEPLERNEISEDRRKEVLATYHNAVAYSDWATGEVINRLKQLGVYKRSLVAVSGDHGESLFDDGILGHGIKITNAQLHALLVTNRLLPELEGLLGQTDLAKALLAGVGAKITPSDNKQSSLIQIIGDLNNPFELGYVYKDGKRFTLDNANGEIHASWLARPKPVSQFDYSTKEYKELHRLAVEWNGIISANNGIENRTPSY